MDQMSRQLNKISWMMSFQSGNNSGKDVISFSLSILYSNFRDPENGFWCDTLRLNQAVMTPCGPSNNFYSAAGTGMGLVTEAIMVELGKLKI